MIRRLAGYYVDANLLVLLAVGDEGRDMIPKHKRLDGYSAGDYDFLRSLLSRVRRVLVTPNALTEASNLIRQHGESERSRFMRRLRGIILESEEIVVPSATAAANSSYEKLGLTDAALLEAATSETLLLTVDAELQRESLNRGQHTVVNFDVIRFR